MPARLDELNNLSIIQPRVEYSNDVLTQRYANAPKVDDAYQNWNIIEDIQSCQTAIPPNSMDPYAMSPYNSNSIIPAYQQATCPSSGMQYIMSQQQQYPNQTNIYDS